MVSNDSMSENSGIELQVRKANYISWKINNKSPYRPSDPIRHTKCFLQGNNTCSGATEGEMKLNIYVGKRISFSSCFFFGHRSYTDFRDKPYYLSGIILRSP